MAALLNVCPANLTKIMLNQNNFQIFLIYNNLDRLGIGSDCSLDKTLQPVGVKGRYGKAQSFAPNMQSEAA